MGALVYAPAVKVHIHTIRHGIIDVTRDLVSGNVQRMVDQVSSANLTMANPARKYDGIFTPNDRIVIQARRISGYMPIFSGYLDSVPFFSVYATEVQLAASCTLKRLQYWLWDPGTTEAYDLIVNGMGAAKASRGAKEDGGVKQRAIDILVGVCEWPLQNIHIGRIPPEWFEFASKIAGEIQANHTIPLMIKALGASANIGGQSMGASPGNYGGVAINSEQVQNATIIYNVGVKVGATDRDIICALMTAKQESQIKNINYGDRDSVGLFQQRPSQGWGTVSQILNPEYSSGKFYEALFKVRNRESLGLTQVCQAVQRSAYPSAYAPHEAMARALHAAIKSGTTMAAPAPATAPSLGAISPAWNSGSPVVGKETFNGVKGWVAWSGNTLKAMFDITRGIGGVAPRGNVSDHPLGLALDFMVSSGAAVGAERQKGEALANYLVANAAKHAVKYLIWYDRIWKASTQNWGPYTHPSKGGGATLRHQDHVHVSYSADGNPAVPSDYQAGGVGTNFVQPPTFTIDDASKLLFNAMEWFQSSASSAISNQLAGARVLMNDQPVLPDIGAFMNASQRSYCSAPNGDFIAWFPDYFGLWGTAAKMVIQDIELQDFSMTWDDHDMVTHQFVVGNHAAPGWSVAAGGGGGGELNSVLQTAGIASVDFPEIMEALFNITPSPENPFIYKDFILKRFGARVLREDIPIIQGGEQEFFMALYLFMRHWSAQWKARIGTTWMPELFPGMLIQLPTFKFQAYVRGVSHTFDFDSGFTTSIDVTAPSTLSADGGFYGLPLAGKRPIKVERTRQPSTNERS